MAGFLCYTVNVRENFDKKVQEIKKMTKMVGMNMNWWWRNSQEGFVRR